MIDNDGEFFEKNILHGIKNINILNTTTRMNFLTICKRFQIKEGN